MNIRTCYHIPVINGLKIFVLVSGEKYNNNVHQKKEVNQPSDGCPTNSVFRRKCYPCRSGYARVDQNQCYKQVPISLVRIFGVDHEGLPIFSLSHALELFFVFALHRFSVWGGLRIQSLEVFFFVQIYDINKNAVCVFTFVKFIISRFFAIRILVSVVIFLKDTHLKIISFRIGRFSESLALRFT